MAAIMIKLECITNMHVGNGDVNYNIIDNEVEKDPVTGYPTINSSGVKGALRQYFAEKKETKDMVDGLFGSDEKKNNTAGKLKILGADMLALPVRASKGDKAFYLVTTEAALDKFETLCSLFLGREGKREYKKVSGRAVEGIELHTAVKVMGKELHVLRSEEFGRLSLPVMARNKLDNGKSKNLWYEEVVPHESIFCFAVLAESDEELKMFRSVVEGKVIQFGGSASIGYGLCKVSVIGEQADE